MSRRTSFARQKVLITTAVCTFWGAVVLLVAIGSVPSSPLAFSRWSRTTLVSVMPEGWGFFTKNPRGAYVVMHRMTPSGLEAVNVVGSRVPQLFGASRSARGREVEFGTLLSLVPKDAWSPCKPPLTRCMKETKVHALRSPLPAGRFCGPFVLEWRDPVPWAWSKGRQEYYFTKSIAQVDILCGVAPASVATNPVGALPAVARK